MDRRLRSEAQDVKDIAAFLGVSTSTIYRWLDQKRKGQSSNTIPAYKVGGKWRFFPEEVREWLDTIKI